MSFQLNIYGDVVFGYLAFYIYIYQISVVVGLGEDCGHIHTTFSSETSLVPTSDSHEWIRDLYHKGLSCQDSPDCKAVAKTTVGSVEAVCSATPGSLPSVGVYIVRRESDIPAPDMWYPFDEIVNGQLKGSKPAEIIGDVQLVEGKAYKALYIDGVHDQYVNLGNLRQYCVGDLRHCQHGLVISVWLRPHVKKPGGYHYFTNGGHTRGSIGVLLAQLDEHLIAFFRNDTGPWTITKVPFEVLNWYFVTMVWDPNSGARLYLNGCLAGEDLTLKNDASNSNGQYNDFIIGASNFPQDRTTTRAEMTMDELKIWDARMTENQVWDLYLCHI